MASPKAIARIETLVWVLIFSGLLTLVLGIASLDHHLAAGWTLVVLGGAAAAAGVVLIWVRSRMAESTIDS
jgi:vacuolar-type H+-ATPase subunit I/STV1